MNNIFLSKFLMITDMRTILFMIAISAVFFIVYLMQKKKVKFSTRMISAT